MSSNPVIRQKESPTLARPTKISTSLSIKSSKTDDTNDVLYANRSVARLRSRSELGKNSRAAARDQFRGRSDNPPELGISKREIKRVSHGSHVIPLSDKTRGHGSHTIAALWKDQLSILLKESAK